MPVVMPVLVLTPLTRQTHQANTEDSRSYCSVHSHRTFIPILVHDPLLSYLEPVFLPKAWLHITGPAPLASPVFWSIPEPSASSQLLMLVSRPTQPQAMPPAHCRTVVLETQSGVALAPPQPTSGRACPWEAPPRLVSTTQPPAVSTVLWACTAGCGTGTRALFMGAAAKTAPRSLAGS